MPSAIAGVAGPTGGRSGAEPLAVLLGRMAVPGLAIGGSVLTGTGAGLLAQGRATLAVVGTGAWRLVDGDVERAEAEVGPGWVVLGRDALGVRPLYFTVSPDRARLAWASRPSQLAAVDWVARDPDWETLLAVLSGSPRPDPAATCVRGIRQVRPGHSVYWRPGRAARQVRTWDAGDHVWNGGRAPADAPGRFAELLAAAVARRTAGPGGDRPTVLLLSGGIDSTCLAAAAARRRLPLDTLSMVYPGLPSADEAAAIAAVLGAVALPHEQVDAAIGSPPPGLDVGAELRLHGEPHGGTNHAGLRLLFSAAGHRGWSTALDGCDGDSALGHLDGLGAHLLRRPRLAAAALRHLQDCGWPAARVVRRWGRDAVGGLVPAVPGWHVRRRWARLSEEPRPLLRSWAPAILDRCRDTAREASTASWRENQRRAADPGPSESIVLMDRLAADCGVDLHHPFADRDLMEFLLGLPPEAKHAGGRWKGVARQAFPELPPAVRDQVRKVDITEAVAARHPLRTLVPHLLDPVVPVPFVDYGRLAQRLAAGTPYEPGELHHLRALALTHAFLAGCHG